MCEVVVVRLSLLSSLHIKSGALRADSHLRGLNTHQTYICRTSPRAAVMLPPLSLIIILNHYYARRACMCERARVLIRRRLHIFNCTQLIIHHQHGAPRHQSVNNHVSFL